MRAVTIVEATAPPEVPTCTWCQNPGHTRDACPRFTIDSPLLEFRNDHRRTCTCFSCVMRRALVRSVP